MSRFVFVADQRPDWERAEQLIRTASGRALRLAGESYDNDDPAAVRAALFSGLANLRAEWDVNFFLEGGVVSADTIELERLGAALSDLGIAQAVGLRVNAAVR